MLFGPVLGYFGHGYFSNVRKLHRGALSDGDTGNGSGDELQHRTDGGRGCAYTIGAVATLPGIGIGLALGVTLAFFLLGAAPIFTLPDRSGQELEA